MTTLAAQIIIRQAKESDLSVLVFLLEILCSIEKDFSFEQERQRRGLRLMLNNRTGVILVAETDSRVIGMGTGQLLISTATGERAAQIEDIVVLPGWQGKGVGGRLMSALDDWAATTGGTRLQLLADQNNDKALAFYKRIGYRRTEMICLRKG